MISAEISHDGCVFTSRVRSSTASTRTTLTTAKIHSGGGCHKDNAFSIPVVCELLEGGLQRLLMTLSLPERLAMLMPPSGFYRRRIAQEARTGEPHAHRAGQDR